MRRLHVRGRADEGCRQKSAAIFPHFCRRFPTVAAMTKALKVLRVHEQSPVAPMGRDVINVGSVDPSALSRALSAKGLFQELHRA